MVVLLDLCPLSISYRDRVQIDGEIDLEATIDEEAQLSDFEEDAHDNQMPTAVAPAPKAEVRACVSCACVCHVRVCVCHACVSCVCVCVI